MNIRIFYSTVFSFAFIIVSGLTFFQNTGFAILIQKTADDQGTFFEDGSHESTSTRATAIGGTHSEDQHAFFSFDFSSINYNITEATLNLFPLGAGTCNPCSDPPMNEFQITSVSTSYIDLAQSYPSGSQEGIAIFNDLGSGTSYGTFTDDPAIFESSIISISLNSSALTDINNTTGYFSLGIEVNLAPNSIWDGMILAEHLNFATLDVTVSTPEPATIVLLGIGLVGLAGGAVRRKWKKKAADKNHAYHCQDG